MKIVTFLMCLGLFVLASCTISKNLKHKPTSLINDTLIKTGHLGISIFEPATQNFLYNYNAEKLFIPASNTKLFTLYAGLKYLGNQLTGIYYQQARDTLFVVPNGDPTFLHTDFTYQPIFEFLKKNNLPIVILNQNQQLQPYGKGWAWDDVSEAYMVQRNSFPIYGNLLHLNWVKENNIQNDAFPYKLQAHSSDYSNFIFIKKLDTANDKNVITKIPFKNKFEVTSNGKLNQFTQEVPFETEGIETAIDLLKNGLEKSIYCKDFKINKEEFKPFYSQNTDTFFKIMMHRSDNFYAEQTLLMSSNLFLGFMSETAFIDTLLKLDFKAIPQQPSWIDGSGLSRYNLFSPKDFIYVLNKIQDEFGINKLKYILPTGGKGTLKNYFQTDSNFIFAKTGSLNNNYTLSGVLKTRKNRTFLFSIMLNNYIGSGRVARKKIEHYIHKLIERN